MSNDNDRPPSTPRMRPLPPRATPASEPTVRSARPQMNTSPEERARIDAALFRDELRKLNEERAEQANFNKAVMQHLCAQDQAHVATARAMRIEDKLPDQIRPRDAKPSTRPSALESTESHAKNGAVATYVTLATTVALIILEVLRRIGGSP